MHFFKNTIKILTFALLIILTSCKAQYPDLEDGMYEEMVTDKGTIVCQLEFEKTPVTIMSWTFGWCVETSFDAKL